ncbi:MAG: RHS repeat-associated core domain-containing protein, partial [Verrucomicrobiota bacterium]
NINGNPVSYDGRGNLTSYQTGASHSVTYDVFDRVIATDSARHYYDNQRNRLRAESSGEKSNFIVDTSGKLPNTVAEVDDEGLVQKSFLYGPDGLLGASHGDAIYFVHQDFNANVVALSDSSGMVTHSRGYTPYGIGSGDELPIPFGFGGGVGVLSEDNDSYQMRARWYFAELRGFSSADIELGGIDSPSSMSRYLYVQGRPMDYIDPSGKSAEDIATYFGYALDAYDVATPALFGIAQATTNPSLGFFAAGMQLVSKAYHFTALGIAVNAFSEKSVSQDLWAAGDSFLNQDGSISYSKTIGISVASISDSIIFGTVRSLLRYRGFFIKSDEEKALYSQFVDSINIRRSFAEIDYTIKQLREIIPNHKLANQRQMRELEHGLSSPQNQVRTWNWIFRRYGR